MKEKRKVIISVGLLLSLALGNILTPTKVFSNKENRYLKELPDLNYKDIISGKFGSDFETFTTDQFIFRDNWISLKTIGDLSLLKKDNGRVYFGKDGYLFDSNQDFSYGELDKNIKYLNKFLEKIDKYSISVNGILVPGKPAVLDNKLPKYAPVLDEEYIKEKLEIGLKNNINLIDLLETLSENKEEYIYYKTDHHWTTKGAYYAYKKYMEEVGEKPIAEKDFMIELVSDEFWGTTYRKANFYRGDPDKIQIYKKDNNINKIIVNGVEELNSLYDNSYLDKVDKYSYFLGGDKALIEIETSIKNNKNLLVIKDSFANSLIPFLTNHYEKIVIIDPRYYKTGVEQLVNEKEINEIILLFNLQNYGEKGRFLPLAN